MVRRLVIWVSCVAPAAAQTQIGGTILFNPSYLGLDFPGGNIPRTHDSCTRLARLYQRQ